MKALKRRELFSSYLLHSLPSAATSLQVSGNAMKAAAAGRTQGGELIEMLLVAMDGRQAAMCHGIYRGREGEERASVSNAHTEH